MNKIKIFVILVLILVISNCKNTSIYEDDSNIFECIKQEVPEQIAEVRNFSEVLIMELIDKKNHKNYESIAKYIDNYRPDSTEIISISEFWGDYRPEKLITCINKETKGESKYHKTLKQLVLFVYQKESFKNEKSLTQEVKGIKEEYFKSDLFIFCLDYCFYHYYQYKKLQKEFKTMPTN